MPPYNANESIVLQSNPKVYDLALNHVVCGKNMEIICVHVFIKSFRKVDQKTSMLLKFVSLEKV